jgi:uncharacterized protein YegL
MAYEQLWGTTSPGHIVYLVDLSASMANKVDYTIEALYSVLRALAIRCNSGINVKPRLTCTVIGYNYKAEVIWDNLSISDIKTKTDACKNNHIPLFDKTKNFKPQYQTCMRLAFDEAKRDIEEWIKQQTKANMLMPAPIVINITDGYPFEGKEFKKEDILNKTLQSAQALKDISTPDGHVLLFNIHHDPESQNSTLIFPSQCPTNAAEKFLFESSSVMEGGMLEMANQQFHAKKGSRCMVCNVKDIEKLTQFIQMGSSQYTEDGRYD